MKDRTLTYLSLALSIGALAYATWIHLHAKQLAAEALRRRELELVTHFAPMLREIYSGMGIEDTNFYAFQPKNLEDLFRPLTHTMSGLSSPETNRPEQKMPK